MVSIFTEVHQTYKSIESRIKAESFKMRIMKIFQAWEDWAVYSKDFLIRVQNAFLGLTGEVSVFIIYKMVPNKFIGVVCFASALRSVMVSTLKKYL